MYIFICMFVFIYFVVYVKKNNSSRSSDAVNRCKVLEKKISISTNLMEVRSALKPSGRNCVDFGLQEWFNSRNVTVVALFSEHVCAWWVLVHGHQPQDAPCEAFNENPLRAAVIPVVSAPFPTTVFPFSSFFNLSQYST